MQHRILKGNVHCVPKGSQHLNGVNAWEPLILIQTASIACTCNSWTSVYDAARDLLMIMNPCCSIWLDRLPFGLQLP